MTEHGSGAGCFEDAAVVSTELPGAHHLSALIQDSGALHHLNSAHCNSPKH